MNQAMDHKSCILCCNNISRTENTFSKEYSLESNNWHGDPLKSQLTTIFFLRKILEIPQEICCTFLKQYGDPCSWVGCCDSCSVFIENGKHIFDQMMKLQKQLKELQNEIKDKITAIEMEGKFREYNGGIEKLIRSYVCKVETFPKEVNIKDDFAHSDLYGRQSNCSLLLTTSNTSNIIVKNEVDVTDVYLHGVTTEAVVGDYNSEEGDPLRLHCSDKFTHNNNFEVENEEEMQHLQIILPKLEPEFHTENINMNFSSIIFHDESEAENSCNGPQTENNTSGNSSTTNESIHTQIKPHECLICGKCFGDSKNLNRHIKLHTGEKPFKCKFCGKCFSHSSHLTVHERMHTGEKPFKCNLCAKCFSNASHLSRHKTTHTGEKRFKCETCGKTFAQSGNLKSHERIHTGEKLFKCNFCGKGFSHSRHLTVHERIHTGEKPFACGYCDKAFSAANGLKNHSKVHSGQNYLAPGYV